MAILLLPSLESCGGVQGISSRGEEVRSSTPKNERVLTMATFLLSSVESCGGDHGVSSREGCLPVWS